MHSENIFETVKPAKAPQRIINQIRSAILDGRFETGGSVADRTGSYGPISV